MDMRRDSLKKVVWVAERYDVFNMRNAHLICSNLVDELLASPLNIHTHTHTHTHTHEHTVICLMLLPLD